MSNKMSIFIECFFSNLTKEKAIFGGREREYISPNFTSKFDT